MQKVKIEEYRGIRDVVAAKVLTDTSTSFTTGTPFSLAWAAELGRETENASESHYYDNVPAIVIDSTGADTVTITGSVIPFDVYAEITGQHYDDDTGMLIEGERVTDYYALGYVTKTTSGEEVFVWRLKGKFGIPSETHATEDDGTEANGQELTFTGINTTYKFNKRGKSERAVNVIKSLCPLTEAQFFASVQTPDTVTNTSILRDLVITCAAGNTSGTKVIDISPYLETGNHWMYKVGATAETVTYDQVLSTGWSDLARDTDITATSGQVVTVVEVTTDDKARKVGSATAVLAQG